MKTSDRRVAVVGIGPRGLGALEALASAAEEAGKSFDVDIFDPCPHPGAGPNFRPDESALCLLNIPVRAISISAADFSGAKVTPFDDWISERAGPEDFPPRAELGAYFAARFDDLRSNAAALSLTHHKRHVDRITRSGDGWHVLTEGTSEGPYAEVLLTLGQADTKPDEQLQRWMEHASANGLDLLPAYPAQDLLEAAENWADKTVAIRGLGLSTHDVLRLLSCGLGGQFDGEAYFASGREPKRIVPFSFNGHPPFPKPDSADFDARFDPTPEETRAIEKAFAAAISESAPDAAVKIICDGLVTPALRVLKAHGAEATQAEIEDWLSTEWDDSGAQESDLDPIEALMLGIAMAEGRTAPTPGYVLGQLWRKWQNELRRAYNPSEVSAGLAEALVGFDEGLKRYSYGPPLSASKDLLALIRAGIVTLCAAEDPDVLLKNTGWLLVEDDSTALAEVMIDAVLPSPAISRTEDELLRDLMAKGYIVPVDEGFGAVIAEDGRLCGPNGAQEGLSLLGRHAIGSVIAVDSIHDCFGAYSKRWGSAVAGRN